MRLRRPDAQRVDELAGLVLGVAGAVEVLGQEATRSPAVVAAALAACPGVAMAMRRRAPLAAVVVFFGAMLALQLLFVSLTHLVLPFVGLLFFPYGAGAFAEGRRAAAGLAVSVVVYVVVTALLGDGTTDFLFGVAVITGAWFAGRTVRVRVQLAAELHEAAQRAEEARDDEAARAVAEERRRIAREMHDVVAHSVSVMVVQAGGARRILAREPERAVEAAARIEETGRAAMAEMRRLLGVLHPGEEEAARAPQPTLAGLGELVERARHAGLPVALVVEGDQRPLAAGVDLAAYRVVQEALTNALKHAGQAQTAVRVRWGQETLELEIVDRGPGPAAWRRAAGAAGGDAGHGLIGMRERVRVYGGELTTGRRRGGGFAVRARLPLTTEETLA
ncbi:MAG TPA: histidine kinase [Solirubrobacteraceae bacterium]|nr:histidine kinase [Solirubrobacteraceae bacterium]